MDVSILEPVFVSFDASYGFALGMGLTLVVSCFVFFFGNILVGLGELFWRWLSARKSPHSCGEK